MKRTTAGMQEDGKQRYYVQTPIARSYIEEIP
jgi:hypothetical protein